MIRRYRGVALDNGDSSHRNFEFFRDHLTDGDPQPGTDIHFARINGHGAIGVDGKKAVDFPRIHRFSEIRSLSRHGSRESAVEREAHDDGAACSKEIASFHRRLLYFGRAQNRGENSSVCGAPAKITSEPLLDLLGCRVRSLAEK